MTTNTTNENTQPEGTRPDGANPDSTAPEGTPRRDATPRTWLRRIARRKRILTHEHWRQLDDVAREGISDEDYATTMATLEAMARNLGWNESESAGEDRKHGWRGRGHKGHGHGHGRGHGHGHDGQRHGRCGARATVEA